MGSEMCIRDRFTMQIKANYRLHSQLAQIILTLSLIHNKKSYRIIKQSKENPNESRERANEISIMRNWQIIVFTYMSHA